jgi:hypothetical protein
MLAAYQTGIKIATTLKVGKSARVYRHSLAVLGPRRHELVAEHAQIEALKGQIDAYRIEVKELCERMGSREA